MDVITYPCLDFNEFNDTGEMYQVMWSNLGPLLLLWFNFDPNMDKW